jgi:hypothetical protein
VTILVDQAYEEANQRTAAWAERLVRRRFSEVFPTNGDEVLNALRERMDHNIQSDGRANDVPPNDVPPNDVPPAGAIPR